MRDLHNTLPLHRLPFLGPYNLDLVADYLSTLKARNYSPKTIYGIAGAIKTFCVLLPPQRQSLLYQDLSQTTLYDVDDFLQVADQSGLAPSTINNTLSSLQGFFSFLQEQGHIRIQPIHKRRHWVMAPPTLPKPMTEEDLTEFFKVIDSVRDRTLFLLMLRCGLRVGEVCTLTFQDIDFQVGTLRINKGKGQVDRVVYLSPDVEKSLRQWQQAQKEKTSYMFTSPYKKAKPYSVRQIQRLMKKYLKQANLTKPYSPHCLRHTFATQLLNAGAPLEVVKELMGHHSISMTLRYTKLYDETKRKQYHQAMERIENHQTI